LKTQDKTSLKENVQHTEYVPTIVQLSVGSEHNIAITGKLLVIRKKYLSNNYNFIIENIYLFIYIYLS